MGREVRARAGEVKSRGRGGQIDRRTEKRGRLGDGEAAGAGVRLGAT